MTTIKYYDLDIDTIARIYGVADEIQRVVIGNQSEVAHAEDLEIAVSILLDIDTHSDAYQPTETQREFLINTFKAFAEYSRECATTNNDPAMIEAAWQEYAGDRESIRKLSMGYVAS